MTAVKVLGLRRRIVATRRLRAGARVYRVPAAKRIAFGKVTAAGD